MFGLGLSIFILAFGIFLKVTKHPGFAPSKRFAWFFIILGTLTTAGKIFILISQNKI